MEAIFEYMDNNEITTLVILFLIGMSIHFWLRLKCYKEENKMLKRHYNNNIK